MHTSKKLNEIRIKPVTCVRCKNIWYPSVDRQGNVNVPKRCANRKCNSPNWNHPEKLRISGVTE